MIGFPIDSHVTYDDDGVPVFDRGITSEPYRKLLKKLFSTGVMPNPSSNYQVTEGTGMTVIVMPGFAMVEGCMKLEEDERTLTVQASDTTYDRIDTVVLRLDNNDDMRICDLYIVAGTPSASPVHPDLTREGSIYEIGLADLFVSKNCTTIAAERITDTRYDTERCGVVSSISEFDTTTLYDQVQADLKNFQEVNEADFTTWVESIKDILDEETAGHLQLEVEALQTRATTAEADIDALETRATNLETAMGTTDISDIGDGTATGAISQLNSNLTALGSGVTPLITTTSSIATDWETAWSKAQGHVVVECWWTVDTYQLRLNVVVPKSVNHSGVTTFFRNGYYVSTSESGMFQFGITSDNSFHECWLVINGTMYNYISGGFGLCFYPF